MSVRREREHVSLPLNAVAMTFAVSSLHHKNRLNFCVRAHPPAFNFALFARSAWRDRRSSTLPEGGTNRLHNALSRICIWRKRGLLGGLAFGQQSLRMTRARRNVRGAGPRPSRSTRTHRTNLKSELFCEMRMRWFSVGVIR